MMKPIDHPEFPWTGIFLGAPILGIWYWCTDQVIVQRVLSAKDEGHAQGRHHLRRLPEDPPGVRPGAPGLIAFALYHAAVHDRERRGDNGDIAYPTLIVNLLPHRPRRADDRGAARRADGRHELGVQLRIDPGDAGLLQALRPEAAENEARGRGPHRHRRHGPPGRRSGCLSSIWISSQLYIYLQSVQAYVSPPIAACFILGILWPRLNGAGAITSLLAGFVLGTLRFVAEVLDKRARRSTPAPSAGW